MLRFVAVILMGGVGERAGSAIPKQFHPLGPLKVYQHALYTFQQSNLFHKIILVCHPAWIHEARQETALINNVKIAPAGETRQASSWQGIKACGPGCDYVMIHDAARPFVSTQILKENYEAVLKYGAVNTCITLSDTLILAEKGSEVNAVPSRNLFRRGQTPQTFAYPLIRKAHQTTTRQNSTDDCQLVIDLGAPVHIVEGSEENFKITTAWDLKIAELLWQNRSLTLY